MQLMEKITYWSTDKNVQEILKVINKETGEITEHKNPNLKK